MRTVTAEDTLDGVLWDYTRHLISGCSPETARHYLSDIALVAEGFTAINNVPVRTAARRHAGDSPLTLVEAIEQRCDALDIVPVQLGERGGPSAPTMRRILAGFTEITPETVAKLEHGLGWTPGVVADHMRTGRPDELIDPPRLQRYDNRITARTYTKAHTHLRAVTVAWASNPTMTRRALNRASEERSAAGKARMYAAWGHLCRWLVAEDWLETNTMDSPKIEPIKLSHNKLPQEIVGNDIVKILSTIAEPDTAARNPWPVRDQLLAAIYLGSGLRVSEACNLLVGHYQAPEEDNPGVLLVIGGKGGKDRDVPTIGAIDALMTTYLEERRARAGSFVPGAGDLTRQSPLLVRSDGTAFTARAMRRLVSRWYARAKVDPHHGHSVHAWRHTFATLAVRSGADLPTVKDLLGHASVATTEIYIKVANVQAAAAIANHPASALIAAGTGQ